MDLDGDENADAWEFHFEVPDEITGDGSYGIDGLYTEVRDLSSTTTLTVSDLVRNTIPVRTVRDVAGGDVRVFTYDGTPYHMLLPLSTEIGGGLMVASALDVFGNTLNLGSNSNGGLLFSWATEELGARNAESFALHRQYAERPVR